MLHDFVSCANHGKRLANAASLGLLQEPAPFLDGVVLVETLSYEVVPPWEAEGAQRWSDEFRKVRALLVPPWAKPLESLSGGGVVFNSASSGEVAKACKGRLSQTASQ